MESDVKNAIKIRLKQDPSLSDDSIVELRKLIKLRAMFARCLQECPNEDFQNRKLLKENIELIEEDIKELLKID